MMFQLSGLYCIAGMNPATVLALAIQAAVYPPSCTYPWEFAVDVSGLDHIRGKVCVGCGGCM